ncbi:MAG TPA: hypothetical protein VFQ51_20710, partial [Vicinamibacteria bacterium]|nr:hypothetical protein [Vicinamibacteria bacterium]
TVPAGLDVLTFVPSVGSYDPGTGAWTDMNLGTGQVADLRLIGQVRPDASGTLTNSAVVSPAGGVSDPAGGNNGASDTNVVRAGWTELAHGVSLSSAIPPSAERFFAMRQDGEASYEVVVDDLSGDLGDAGSPLRLQRLSPNLVPLQESTAAGLGPARSLRWQSVGEEELVVRVASGQCASACGAADVFRVRAYDTTYDLARFNNAGSQVSVLLLQNIGRGAAHGTVRFWSEFGSLIVEVPFAIQSPNGLYVLATASLSELQGESGSVTVTSDAPYATLAGKIVSLDPATGFSFDTPMRPRPR